MALILSAALALTSSSADAAVRWTKPVRTFAAASKPVLAVDGQGAVTVAGEMHGGVLVRRRTARGHWLHAQGFLSRADYLESIDVAAARDGQVVLVYSEQEAAVAEPFRTFLVARGRTGSFQSPLALPTIMGVTVGVDDAGRAVVAGRTRDGAVIAVRRAADGVLSDLQRIAEPGDGSLGDEGGAGPALAVGAGGRAVLVWVRLSKDRRTTVLEAAMAAPGEPFGAPQEVARYVAGPYDGNGGGEVGIRDVTAAVNGRGQSALAWMVGGTTIGDHFRPNTSDVMAAGAPADGVFGTPRLVSAQTGAWGLQITLDPLGGGALVWRSVTAPCNSDGECAGSALLSATALADAHFGSVRRLLAQTPYADALTSDRAGDTLFAYHRTTSYQARRCPGPAGMARAPGQAFGKGARIAAGACIGYPIIAAGGGRRTLAVAWNRAVDRLHPPVDVVVGRFG